MADELSNVLGDLMVKAIKNKDEITVEVLKSLQQTALMEKGLTHFVELIDESKSVNGTPYCEPHELARMIRALSKSCRAQSKIIQNLSAILLVYLIGDSFQSDAAKAALRVGRGKEALREFGRAKFGL